MDILHKRIRMWSISRLYSLYRVRNRLGKTRISFELNDNSRPYLHRQETDRLYRRIFNVWSLLIQPLSHVSPRFIRKEEGGHLHIFHKYICACLHSVLIKYIFHLYFLWNSWTHKYSQNDSQLYLLFGARAWIKTKKLFVVYSDLRNSSLVLYSIGLLLHKKLVSCPGCILCCLWSRDYYDDVHTRVAEISLWKPNVRQIKIGFHLNCKDKSSATVQEEIRLRNRP